VSALDKFRQGMLVRHKTKGYLGIFHGVTRIKHLLELPLDVVGCRILVRSGSSSTFQIASPDNLVNLADLSLEERHEAHLAFFNIIGKGVRKTTIDRRHRVTHCWMCKGPLDNAVDFECVVCGWILCQCGACGCGFS